MTKTYKEIVYSILESVYKFKITDDADITKRFVIKKIADVNVRIIEEAVKQGQNIDMLYQKICCIEIGCEKPVCETELSGDVLWTAEIPLLNSKIGEKNIKYVGLTDLVTPFRRVTFDALQVSNALDFTSGPVFTVIGNKAYFKNLPTMGIKYICLVGILADPITACNFDENIPYPTPDPYKLELLVKQDILSSYGIPKDEIQDSRDSQASQPVEQPKQTTNE